MIYCLMTAGIQVSAVVADLLFDAAVQMMHKGTPKLVVRNDDMDGVVETNFERVEFADICGIKFDAMVQTVQGTGNVRFIARGEDLDAAQRQRLKWSERPIIRVIPIERDNLN